MKKIGALTCFRFSIRPICLCIMLKVSSDKMNESLSDTKTISQDS